MGPGNAAAAVLGGGEPNPDNVPGSGGPRSASTRRAILDAARSAFAAHGYEQTTIRAVAATAGVDASMVMRYFGSKAGLFAAVATADLAVPDLRQAPAAERGEVLVRHVVDRWEDTTRDDELILLLRTAVTNEAVALQLQDALARLVTDPVAALGAPDAAERGAFIGAQLLGLALCRYILRLEPLASMPAAQVTAAVAPSVQSYLDDLTVPDSAGWQRRWTIDAGRVTIRPVTRRFAQDVLDGGPALREFEEGSLHARLPQAMDIAIRAINSGAAVALPVVWLIIRPTDGRILGDIGTHGPPDNQGCVEIGYSLAPSARGQGIGTAAVTAFVRRLAQEPGIRRITAVTGAQNTASRLLLERQGFHHTDTLPDTDEVRYTRILT